MTKQCAGNAGRNVVELYPRALNGESRPVGLEAKAQHNYALRFVSHIPLNGTLEVISMNGRGNLYKVPVPKAEIPDGHCGYVRFIYDKGKTSALLFFEGPVDETYQGFTGQIKELDKLKTYRLPVQANNVYIGPVTSNSH